MNNVRIRDTVTTAFPLSYTPPKGFILNTNYQVVGLGPSDVFVDQAFVLFCTVQVEGSNGSQYLYTHEIGEYEPHYRQLGHFPCKPGLHHVKL